MSPDQPLRWRHGPRKLFEKKKRGTGADWLDRLGSIGLPMAKRLSKQGYAVTVCGHTRREPVEEMKQLGAREVATPYDDHPLRIGLPSATRPSRLTMITAGTKVNPTQLRH